MINSLSSQLVPSLGSFHKSLPFYRRRTGRQTCGVCRVLGTKMSGRDKDHIGLFQGLGVEFVTGCGGNPDPRGLTGEAETLWARPSPGGLDESGKAKESAWRAQQTTLGPPKLKIH